jgi:hypothetical protein
MASPLSGGTKHGAAVSSRDVTVLHEWILVKPDRKFNAAQFIVTYEIDCSRRTADTATLYCQELHRGFSRNGR